MIDELVGDGKRSNSNSTDKSTGNSQDSSFEKYNQREEQMLTNESLQSFITDSPFSFRNPIFFSVPREQGAYTKKVNPVISKRQLFTDIIDEEPQKSQTQTF